MATTKLPKVVIVGAGALGSHTAMLLRGEAELKVIDFDRIEQKNVLAQFHAKTLVGKNKAEALKQTMNFLWGTKVEAIPHKLTSENARQMLLSAKLVIDCLDNAEGRFAIRNAIRVAKTSTPTGGVHLDVKPSEDRVACLHGALSAGGELGRVVWDDHFTIDSASEGAATCEGGEHLPFIAMTASYLAYAAQQFLRHGKKTSYHVFRYGAQAL
jgi:hypothetical protein